MPEADIPNHLRTLKIKINSSQLYYKNCINKLAIDLHYISNFFLNLQYKHVKLTLMVQLYGENSNKMIHRGKV